MDVPAGRELARLRERFDFTDQQLADMRAEVEGDLAEKKPGG